MPPAPVHTCRSRRAAAFIRAHPEASPLAVSLHFGCSVGSIRKAHIKLYGATWPRRAKPIRSPRLIRTPEAFIVAEHLSYLEAA